MGAIIHELQRVCLEKGVKIRNNAKVKNIIVENGVSKGVVLENGE